MLIFLMGFLIISMAASAQTWRWHIAAGNTMYFGDLGNERHFPFSEIHHGFLGGLSYAFPARNGRASMFTAEGNLTYLRIGYDETKPLLFSRVSGTDLRNFRRGLNFRNDLIGFDGRMVFTLPPFRNRPDYKQRLALYFFAGAGMFRSNPKADLFRGPIHPANRYYYWNDGTLRDAPEGTDQARIVARDGEYETTLREWYTEGQSRYRVAGQKQMYSLWQPAFPHGGGFRLYTSRFSHLALEISFYDFFFSDYLDDASHRYATYAEIERNFPGDPYRQELARYITDPSGWGSDGYNGPASSRRGNPQKFDWVYFMNLRYMMEFHQPKMASYKSRTKKGQGCPAF
ncbi:MAG: hypothetical protein NZL95_04665 [Chitinophagales bacterium]|nr:hypothetical protein [Chitinophagales bacterium]MDW8427825.1 hypothetical protein [Chitinophagales bacterium]